MAKKILITVRDILKEEYLDPMSISAYRLAHEIENFILQTICKSCGISNFQEYKKFLL